MAFPAITETATTNGTAASATPVITMPGTINAGDLLLVVFRTADGTLGVTWPGDWTELTESTADASNDAMSIGYKVAAGGDTLSLITSSAKFAACCYRITGQAAGAPEISTAATGTSATPDPGALTPAGGANDYLWIWAGGWEGEQTSPPASNPSGYSLGVIGANSGTAGAVTINCRVAMAGRNLENASTENPGSWTISASDDWTAYTLAITPSATVDLSAITNAVSTFSAEATQPNVTHSLDGTSAGVSAASANAGQPNVTHPLDGVSNGASTVTADLTVTLGGIVLEGNPSAGVSLMATAADQPNVALTLETVSAGVSAISADVAQPNVAHSLEGVSAGASSVTGTLDVPSTVQLVGNPSNGVSKMTGQGEQGHAVALGTQAELSDPIPIFIFC